MSKIVAKIYNCNDMNEKQLLKYFYTRIQAMCRMLYNTVTVGFFPTDFYHNLSGPILKYLRKTISAILTHTFFKWLLHFVYLITRLEFYSTTPQSHVSFALCIIDTLCDTYQPRLYAIELLL